MPELTRVLGAIETLVSGSFDHLHIFALVDSLGPLLLIPCVTERLMLLSGNSPR